MGRQHSAPDTSLQLSEDFVSCFAFADFAPPAALRNGHAMTIYCNLRPRRFVRAAWPSEIRYFQTEPETKVLAHCHWQQNRHQHPTMLIVHGLEGSAERAYVLGTTTKAIGSGFNVMRLNVRNCGGTEHLTPTLYHSGLTTDLRAIIAELIARDGLSEIYLIGFSMGGNQVLKYAGEAGAGVPAELCGLVAISPAIDLAKCSAAISRRQCFIYEQRFLRSLKKKVRRKNDLFPGYADTARVGRVRSLREFDDVVTGPYWGFGDSQGYYQQASARPLLPHISVPALIISAQDDPFIPPESFPLADIAANPHLILNLTRYGGHVGFYARPSASGSSDDRYWAEAQAVQFCRMVSDLRVL